MLIGTFFLSQNYLYRVTSDIVVPILWYADYFYRIDMIILLNNTYAHMLFNCLHKTPFYKINKTLTVFLF